MKKKSVLFIGMGAIGSLYASKCNMDLATIFCLARTDYSHIKNHGITILQPNKKEKHWKPTVCFNSLSQCDLEQLDFIVITTKAIDNEAILNILPKKLPAHLSIVLLQNGIDIEEPFIQRYPKITILSGVVNVCVTKIGAGYIHHQDYGRLVIGKYPSGEHQLANDFIQLLKVVISTLMLVHQ